MVGVCTTDCLRCTIFRGSCHLQARLGKLLTETKYLDGKVKRSGSDIVQKEGLGSIQADIK